MADTSVLTEATKAVSYVVALAIMAIWQERKRKSGSTTHEDKLGKRFDDIHTSIAENRELTVESINELKLSINTIGTVVGVDNNNGLRGEMKNLREDVTHLMIEQARNGDPR